MCVCINNNCGTQFYIFPFDPICLTMGWQVWIKGSPLDPNFFLYLVSSHTTSINCSDRSTSTTRTTPKYTKWRTWNEKKKLPSQRTVDIVVMRFDDASQMQTIDAYLSHSISLPNELKFGFVVICRYIECVVCVFPLPKTTEFHSIAIAILTDDIVTNPI